MADWMRNAWYQAAWSNEIAASGLLARTLLGQAIVFFRGAEGKLAALEDRCPHRFAPLSKGQICEGVLRCPYHGLAFDAAGNCAANPHGPITSAMHVRAFSIVERHDAIWIWMGDEGKDDPDLITDLRFIDETPATARIQGYMPTKANYQLIVDNIMDLSHADYIHPTTLGGMMTGSEARTRESNGRVRTDWAALDCAEAPPPFRAQVPASQNMDIRISVEWQAPALMQLGVSVLPAGAEVTPDDENWTLHNMTPESETTTHYFFCATRRKNLHDVGFTAFLRNSIERAFLEEDKPILEAQQRVMGTPDLWAGKPVLLSIDNGAVRVRRFLEKLIAEEN